jgi:hypothetical protein
MKENKNLKYEHALTAFKNGDFYSAKEYLKSTLLDKPSRDIETKAKDLLKVLSFDFRNVYVIIFSISVLSILYTYFKFIY